MNSLPAYSVGNQQLFRCRYTRTNDPPFPRSELLRSGGAYLRIPSSRSCISSYSLTAAHWTANDAACQLFGRRFVPSPHFAIPRGCALVNAWLGAPSFPLLPAEWARPDKVSRSSPDSLLGSLPHPPNRAIFPTPAYSGSGLRRRSDRHQDRSRVTRRIVLSIGLLGSRTTPIFAQAATLNSFGRDSRSPTERLRQFFTRSFRCSGI